MVAQGRRLLCAAIGGHGRLPACKCLRMRAYACLCLPASACLRLPACACLAVHPPCALLPTCPPSCAYPPVAKRAPAHASLRASPPERTDFHAPQPIAGGGASTSSLPQKRPATWTAIATSAVTEWLKSRSMDTLPEWSKGVDSSSTSASCVGSNPTGVIEADRPQRSILRAKPTIIVARRSCSAHGDIHPKLAKPWTHWGPRCH